MAWNRNKSSGGGSNAPSNPDNAERAKEILDKLASIESFQPNDWEKGFLNDQDARFQKYDEVRISDKQLAIFEKILAKAEGRDEDDRPKARGGDGRSEPVIKDIRAYGKEGCLEVHPPENKQCQVTLCGQLLTSLPPAKAVGWAEFMTKEDDEGMSILDAIVSVSGELQDLYGVANQVPAAESDADPDKLPF